METAIPLNAPVPVLLSDTACAALVVPTVWLGKLSDAGDAAIPVLPVVYDDASKAAAPTAPVAAKPAASQGAETPTPPPAKAKPLAGS